ncbi:MAG: FAD-binding protein [Clostridia bacterium]|nr:FAD-binding protein [Clostridia bacterium]
MTCRDPQMLTADVLIIGGGGAACRAAVEAAQAGAQVAMVLKGKLGHSGTTAAHVADTAGYNAADGIVDPSDAPEVHYQDIIQAGQGMANPKLAEILAFEAVPSAKYLESLGVQFERQGDRYVEVRGCFASKPRMHILRDHGTAIMNALVPLVRQLGITVVEDVTVVDLLVEDGICVGAWGIGADGQPLVLAAPSTILAAGGAGQLFKYSLAPGDITGDGYAMGYRAGAELVNMEFMQAVVGIIHPIKSQFNAFLWALHPRLYNATGEEFLSSYLPAGLTPAEAMDYKSRHFPFSVADPGRYVEIAIQKEKLAGRGSSHGGVYVDLTGIGDQDIQALPADSPLRGVYGAVKDWLLARGVDISRLPLEVVVYAHAINGGLKIDEWGETTIAGLYACGEVAGGPHGADRLGGNMLLTCQVFGARAGRAAARRAKAATSSTKALQSKANAQAQIRLQAAFSLAGTSSGIENSEIAVARAKEIRHRLQEACWQGLLVVRTEPGLEALLAELDVMEDDLTRLGQPWQTNKTLVQTANLITVARVIAAAARKRAESRGGHYREDHPYTSERFAYPLAVRAKEGNPQVFPCQW